MKPKAITREMWDVVPSYIVDIEADQPGTLLRSDRFASRIIHLSILPQYRNAIPPTQEWLNGIVEGTTSLEEWIATTDQPNVYLVREGARIIFRDEGIQTHNGFPQAHIVGPAELREEV
jgi:hypothetical protein